MKKSIIEKFKRAVRIAARSLTVAALLGTAYAQSGINTRSGVFTNAGTLNITNASGGSALLIAGSGTATVNSSNITVYRGRGLAIFPNFAFTNSGTDALTFQFDVTYSGANAGTNTSTTQPVQVAINGNGTSQVIGFTNIPSAWLDNTIYVRLSKIANAHASSAFLTNVAWSVYP